MTVSDFGFFKKLKVTWFYMFGFNIARQAMSFLYHFDFQLGKY